MIHLTGAQKRYLKALAHSRDPLVTVGKRGLTDKILAALEQALTVYELVNVRLRAERQERKASAKTLAESSGSQLIALVGSRATFYRQHPDETKRKVTLPLG